MISERDDLIHDFLADAGLTGAVRQPLPGDASTRRYERLLAPDGRRLMLMDAPPAAETRPCGPEATPEERRAAGYNALARLAAGRVDAFAAAAGFLRGHGLSAPEVLALDADNGLALVEDLGDGVFVRLIEAGAESRELYFAAVEAVARLHEAAPPDVLEVQGARWPLLAYDDLALKTGADLFLEWYPQLAGRDGFPADATDEWEALWAPIRARGAAGATVFIHRDYHAENLIWLPDRTGAARVGMVDFQDALKAHPAWDLHSLLQDARRDVAPELETAALEHYFSLRPEVDRDAFLQDYASLAALNEVRILGIFARLVVRDGKPRYRQFVPRMWRCLERNLEQPALSSLKAWFDRHSPMAVRP